MLKVRFAGLAVRGVAFGVGAPLIRPSPVSAGGCNGTMTSATLDAAGRVLTVTDPLGHVTRYTYDAGATGTAHSGAGDSGVLRNLDGFEAERESTAEPHLLLQRQRVVVTGANIAQELLQTVASEEAASTGGLHR